jgi:catalase
MAVRFYLPNGTMTDLIMLPFPLFPASTPEETLEFLKTVKPEIPNGQPDFEKAKEFAATRPGVAHALQLILAMPAAVSFAQTTYHALHAFRFVNAANEVTHGRYHWVPVAGEAGQTPAELASLPPTHLYDELEARLALNPVQFDLVLQIAGDGDSLVDPNSPWPEDRPRVTIGRLEITRPTSVEELGDAVMMHDPTRLTDGIEPTDDPILAARRGIYEVSVAHRTGGWKGRLAALERGGCPFLGTPQS